MYYIDSTGKRVYTLKVRFALSYSFRSTSEQSNPFSHRISSTNTLQKETPEDKVTESAHPARFSPDDKFSAQRVACKKRFGIYLPSTPEKPL